jgi:predicted phage baseplate assembly protein
MKRLAPNYFDRRFDDLVEAGRSRLPSLAPRWTDYNAHDPGVTLMELLAYVGEAQLYGLARMRRDERAAYAALLGLRTAGPDPAHGVLWADRSDRDAPVSSFKQSIVLEEDALVRTTISPTPAFHPTHRMLWTPGRIVSLRARLASGATIDLTRSNEYGDRAFEPFGAIAGPNDLLRLDFKTHGDQGLFPKQRALAADAAWPIGVLVDEPAIRLVAHADAAPAAAKLRVSLKDGIDSIELPILDDGTHGFMRSGVLLLDVSQVPDSPIEFTIEIAAVRGFARPPRIRRIEPGALPIVQGGAVRNEAHAALGRPSQVVKLAVPGLRSGAGVAPVKVVVVESGLRREWRQVPDLAGSGPRDLDYELDTAREAIVFGNGVNGAMPPFEAQIFIDYPFCGGQSANTPRNQRWSVRGIAGVFGTNLDPVGGGRDALGDADLRREARRRLRESHPLVTAADIENAARSLPDLEVARTRVPPIAASLESPTEIVLIALRARFGADEPAVAPETARWLAAVRRALLARMPLGTRLLVRAPDYRGFGVKAALAVQPRRDPEAVLEKVRAKLRDAFAMAPREGLVLREFGVPLTARDLAALLRSVPGVQCVSALSLVVEGAELKELSLSRYQLARLDLASSTLTVAPVTQGAP